jgi:cytochrome c553
MSTTSYAWVAFTLAGVIAVTAATTAQAQEAVTGSAEAGAQKVTVCMACHGPNGNSVNAEWPSLAGQNAHYIREQLRLFRAAHRSHVVMAAQATALTDQDIADIAAYYATQTPAGLEADPSYWKAGEALYRGGDRKRNIPSCKACHGPVGLGNPAAGYPALRAQHAVYTISQLKQYAADARYVDAAGVQQKSRNGHMMTTVSKRLSEEDMRNLGSYIQGLR